MIFDAQVELGRYQAAVETAQAMVDRKPAQGSLARVSYARELLGDPDGAVAAMVQAAAAGGDLAGRPGLCPDADRHLHLGRVARPGRGRHGRALDVRPGDGLAGAGSARSRPPATWPGRPGSWSRSPPACPCPRPSPCSATSAASGREAKPPPSTAWSG